MFAPHCPRHGSRVLLSLDALEIINTASGIEYAWTCSCGHRGVGRARPTRTRGAPSLHV